VIALPPFAPALNEILADVVPISLELSAVGAKGTTLDVVTETDDELAPLPFAFTARITTEYVVPPLRPLIVTGELVVAGLKDVNVLPPFVEY
jgi:hypothetical protein